jgi:hypothetical protein
MPTSVGPNPSADNSIVFSYDVGDTSNSYIGEPTTNYQWNSGYEVTPWTVGGINTDVTNTADQGPIKNAKTWKFQKTGTSNQWNGWESSYGGIWTGNAGDIWTTSYWYKTTNDAGMGGFWVGSFYLSDWSRPYNATVLANVSSIIPDGQWHYNYTVTQINENYSNAIIVDGPSWGYSGNSGTLFINGLQWEKKPHPTPFAYGTRSATQGLLPLISNTSLNISTVSFNSNAQIVFDGTDDYINLPTNFQSGYTQATYEFICKPTSLPGNYNYFQLYIQESNTWMALYTYAGTTFFGIDLGNNSGWFDDNGGFNTGARTTATLTANTYYHIVYSWDGTVVRIYLNGVLQSTTSTLQASNGRQNVTVLGTGGTPRNIGARGNGYYWPGTIDVVKFYNTAISTDQVQQNYRQYKSRFNLS